MRPTAAEQATLDAVAQRFAMRDPRPEPLAGGLGNRCWRLRDAHRDLVVRLGAADAPALGVSRDDEILAQRCAAAQGLAPPVLWHEAASGLLVTGFVTGDGWSLDRARQPAAAARAGAWLRALHRTEPPSGLARVDFGERAAQLARSVPPAVLSPRLAERARRQRRRLGEAPAPVLCHHDLHHLNIIETGTGLRVLDWEYAGAGDPLMDLAGYAAYHDLGEAALAALLSAYTGGERWDRAEEGLDAARWLFELVWLLWLEHPRSGGGGEPAALAATRRRLRARLAGAPAA